MNKNLLFDFKVDKSSNTIHVERAFAAALPLVWDAWTKPEIMDLWWAPKPYQTVTKFMDFRDGGHWLYAMMSPEGMAHWCRADYQQIKHRQGFTALDAFCDENGNVNQEMPRSLWANSFVSNNPDSTTVQIEIKYQSLEDLEKVVELGFKEGFAMALGNLDAYFDEMSA